MPSAGGKSAKLAIRWTVSAQKAFRQTLDYIHLQDPTTDTLIDQRVNNALEAIANQPGIGTLTQSPGVRKFPIPKTGHSIEYRVSAREIIVTRWARQRKKS